MQPRALATGYSSVFQRLAVVIQCPQGSPAGMTRDEASKLLRGGREGIAERNRRPGPGGEVPPLSNANFSGAELLDALQNK